MKPSKPVSTHLYVSYMLVALLYARTQLYTKPRLTSLVPYYASCVQAPFKCTMCKPTGMLFARSARYSGSSTYRQGSRNSYSNSYAVDKTSKDHRPPLQLRPPSGRARGTRNACAHAHEQYVWTGFSPLGLGTSVLTVKTSLNCLPSHTNQYSSRP